MSLTATEQKMLAAIDPARMLAPTLTWAEVNSGTGNMTGLAAMAVVAAVAQIGRTPHEWSRRVLRRPAHQY